MAAVARVRVFFKLHHVAIDEIPQAHEPVHSGYKTILFMTVSDLHLLAAAQAEKVHNVSYNGNKTKDGNLKTEKNPKKGCRKITRNSQT